jgi:NADH:ubiquinone oxidoreductase subunit 2 (subunit N)
VGLGLGVLNTVLGAAVYLRVIRVMVLENATQDRHDISTGEMIFLGVLAMGIVLLGLVWDPLLSHIIPMAEGLAR